MVGSILGLDHQNRAGRVGYHLGGGAAQEGPGLACQAATADDDEIGFLVFGRLDDLIRGEARWPGSPRR